MEISDIIFIMHELQRAMSESVKKKFAPQLVDYNCILGGRLLTWRVSLFAAKPRTFVRAVFLQMLSGKSLQLYFLVSVMYFEKLTAVSLLWLLDKKA